MSKLVGNELPADLYDLLKGNDLPAKTDKTILIVTIDSQGWAHPAMLSYAEVVAKDRKNIRLGTYRDSTTTNNIRRNAKLTVVIVDRNITYYVKGTAREIRPSLEGFPYIAAINMAVDQVLEDKASEEFEPGAYISSGITFYNPTKQEFISRGEKVLRELLRD